jgi:hypothetical protein
MVGVGEEDRLRSVQILTDIALARLDVESLLVELLDRVRDVLQADTAAVLLLESGTQELVARAARGIEDEVYQGVRNDDVALVAIRRDPALGDPAAEPTAGEHTPLAGST